MRSSVLVRDRGSALIYWLANRQFDAGRGDFFYLADAFLHGRTWLDFQPGPYDVIIATGRFYVPFAPFPAIVFMPLVAIIGPVSADHSRAGSTPSSRPPAVGMCWMLARPDRRSRSWSTGSGWSSCSASRPRSCGSRRAAASGTPASSSPRS